MANKKMLEAMVNTCKGHVAIYEKRVEDLNDKIKETKKEFNKTIDDLKENKSSNLSKVYEGPMDNVLCIVRWLEAQHNKDIKIREEMKEVRIV